jgi:hypothetical protein
MEPIQIIGVKIYLFTLPGIFLKRIGYEYYADSIAALKGSKPVNIVFDLKTLLKNGLRIIIFLLLIKE